MDYEDDFDFSDEHGGIETNLDPFNFRDPTSTYLFLSDDVQDELENRQKRKIKCSFCGCEFFRQIGV